MNEDENREVQILIVEFSDGKKASVPIPAIYIEGEAEVKAVKVSLSPPMNLKEDCSFGIFDGAE